MHNTLTVLLWCRRRVWGAASGRTGGRGLSTPVVIQGRGGGRHFRLFGLGIGLGGGTGFTCNLASVLLITLVKAQDKLLEGVEGSQFWVVNHLCFGTRENYGVKVQLRITTALLDDVNERS